MKPKSELPTPEEDAAIQAGIDADPDNPELTDEFFRNAQPAAEVVPEVVRRHRRPQRRATKGRPGGGGSGP
jgi:hypothetical protein